jgi:glutamyl-tRNA synthetase
MEELIEKYALANALKYGGKANPGNIIGQIVKENPDAKQHIKTIQQQATAIVEAVNKLTLEEQKARLEALAPELLEKKEHKEHDLFAFLGVEQGQTLITGFPPEPSKYPHIGHAKACLANYEFAKRYGGKFHLRFDDTNPTLARKEFYDIILDNLKWLGVHPDRVDIASDNMDKFYTVAEILMKHGHVFVCDCDADLTNNLRYNGQACPHRNQPVEETLERWKQLKEGEVLRLRIAADHKNTTMRDPTIFRVIKEPHVRTGSTYHIWPTYDFETCLMDSFQSITYRLRSKEFELRTELHNYIQNLLGYPPTKYYEFARFELEGVETQGRVIREKIASKEYVGWDDPALATLVALRRRGFTPEAIKSFILSTGLTKNNSTLTWDDLYLHNRRVLNETAKRLFFVAEPMLVKINGAPKKHVKLNYFPSTKKGERSFDTHEEFYLAADDFSALQPGELYRLMDCVNFIEEPEDNYQYHSDDIETYRQSGSRIMHFIPKEHDAVHVEVLMPDKQVVKGLGESRVKQLHVGDIIQFERFGFCRLDSVAHGTYTFWFTHK